MQVSNIMSKNALLQMAGVNLMNDDRFKQMFENPDFQIDPDSEEFRLLNPVLSRLEVSKQKEKEKIAEKFEEVQVRDCILLLYPFTWHCLWKREREYAGVCMWIHVYLLMRILMISFYKQFFLLVDVWIFSYVWYDQKSEKNFGIS